MLAPTAVSRPLTVTLAPTDTSLSPTATLAPTATPRPPTATSTPTRTPRPTSTPIPIATPVPVSAILYSEDFEAGVADNWTTYAGTWSVVEDGGNHFWRGTGPTNYPQAWLDVDYTDWTNYAFESRIRFIKGAVFICVRTDGGSAFYNAHISSSDDWISFADYDGGGYRTFGDIGHSIRTNKWYTVRFEVEGSRLRLYIDDRLITAAHRSSREQGGVGYYMGGGDEIHFDDIRIWALTP
jgi:pectate lyase